MATAVREITSGNRVAEARRAAGLTQAEFGRHVGLTLWEVDQLECGERDPRPHIGAISEVTGLPPAYFAPVRPRVPAMVTEEPAAEVSEPGSADSGRLIVLTSLTILLTIRFFSESIGVLPKPVAYVDIPIFFIVVGAAFFVSGRTAPMPTSLRMVGMLTLAFGAMTALSTLVNLERIQPAPVLTFLYLFTGPVAFGYAVYRLWPTGNVRFTTTWLFALALVELAVVVFINIPRFIAQGQNPDTISGTFGENGYQLVFFLLVIVAMLAGALVHDRGRTMTRLTVPVLIGSGLTIFLVQYRSMLITIFLTLLLVGYFLRASNARAVFAGVAVPIILFASFQFISSQFRSLKYESAVATLESSSGTVVDARLEVAGDVSSVYSEDPTRVFTGTGPGTFSSRAWRTFSDADNEKAAQGGFAKSLTGGELYRTDVADKYTLPRYRNAESIDGSVNFTQPFMSYTAVAAEIGLAGLVLILGIYVAGLVLAINMARKAIRHSNGVDALPGLALATVCAFFVLIQLGVFDNWLETTRITFFSWALLAITAREIQARHEA